MPANVVSAVVECDPPRQLAFVVDGAPPNDVTLTLLEPVPGGFRIRRIFVLEDRSTVGRVEFDPPLEVPGLLSDRIVVSFPPKLYLPGQFPTG